MSASKRDELVQKALKVFYQEGFHATGMDKLVAETKISKTSMYKHFRTKEDLILATLRLRDEQFRNQLIRRAKELSSTPKEELLAMFDAMRDWFDDPKYKSCMFIKASSEYHDSSHPIHALSAEHKRILREYFAELATEAGLKNPDDLARQLVLLKEGAIVITHLHKDTDAAADAKAAAEILIAAAE